MVVENGTQDADVFRSPNLSSTALSTYSTAPSSAFSTSSPEMYLTSHAAGWTAPVTWKNPCPHSLRGGSCLQRESTGVVFINNTLLATGGGYGKIPALITRGVNKDRAATAQLLQSTILTLMKWRRSRQCSTRSLKYRLNRLSNINVKQNNWRLILITEQKALITHMLTEGD